MKKFFKQLRGVTDGTKFTPPYAILLMTDLEGRLLENVELQLSIWWKCTDDIFFIMEYGEDSLELFTCENIYIYLN